MSSSGHHLEDHLAVVAAKHVDMSNWVWTYPEHAHPTESAANCQRLRGQWLQIRAVLEQTERCTKAVRMTICPCKKIWVGRALDRIQVPARIFLAKFPLMLILQGKNGILFICGRCLMYFLFRVCMWQMNHVSESIFGFKKVCHHILVGLFIGTRRVSIELEENKIMPVRSRWPLPSLALAGVSCWQSCSADVKQLDLFDGPR